MQHILVYDSSAEELEEIASQNDSSVAELIEEMIELYKENE